MKKEQQISPLQNEQQIHETKLRQNINENNHFPVKMIENKLCKRCQCIDRFKAKGTNVKCQGCSINFKKDIPLCPTCFSDFHKRIQYFSIKMRSSISNKMRIIRRKQSRYLKSYKKQKQMIQIKKEQKVNEKIINNQQNGLLQGQNQAKFTEKILKLNCILRQTFELTGKLTKCGQSNLLKKFLYYASIKSFNRMNKISTNSQLNTGLTKTGALISKICKDDNREHLLILNFIERFGAEGFKQALQVKRREQQQRMNDE